jgi:hypothetical protein
MSAVVAVSPESEFNSTARRVAEKLSRRGTKYRCIFMEINSHEERKELSGAGKRNVKEL